MWGDIPAKGWRIHPRPEAVAFCCRGNKPTLPGKAAGRETVQTTEKPDEVY
jgi:hypothetical protein